jgi:hypothetical protein
MLWKIYLKNYRVEMYLMFQKISIAIPKLCGRQNPFPNYCAIHEYMKIIAPIEACMVNCYGDDTLFPEFCRQIGIRFMRKGNMACGYGCCNTRFERVCG